LDIAIQGDGFFKVVLPDRTIAYTRNGQFRLDAEGRIELAKFVNPAGLRRIGNNLFIQTDASGEPVIDNPGNQGLGTLLQGYLESSNVNIVEEMVSLIIAQRAFEFNTKGITAADEMLGQTANLRR
jgi:flagellar basal-body rod protein FlgG